MSDHSDARVGQPITQARFPTAFAELSVEDLALIAPRLGSIMLEVGQRAWTLYYAAKAENWRMARSQFQEICELFEQAAIVRPQFAEHLHTFAKDDWAPIGEAIQALDFATLEPAFHQAIAQANAYHDLEHHGFIHWELPDTPPPALNLAPRQHDRTLGDSLGRARHESVDQLRSAGSPDEGGPPHPHPLPLSGGEGV